MINHPEYQLKRWSIPTGIDAAIQAELSAYPVAVAQILFNRGLATASAAVEYLSPETRVDHDPFSLRGMEQAIRLIQFAISTGEKIVVYGDYDVDGVTATVLLAEVIEGLGGNVLAYIPDRFEEGYGLNLEALGKLKADGTRLVISVDCGIRSIAEADFCSKNQLKLVITDHHHPSEEIPQADAVINPKFADQDYPYTDLAGVGVAYKVAQALLQSLTGSPIQADRWLDLVALGTVADMAPLTGENRWLVKSGLNVIRAGKRMGLQALFRVAGVNQSRCTSTDIGFTIGPRLNAAGRLDTAMNAFKLLRVADEDTAGKLAAELNDRNSDRQKLTRETQEKAAERIKLDDDKNNFLLFVTDPDFSEGIVGLAASRLVEQFYRPAMVGHDDGVYTRCSCRSIPDFHIAIALDEVKELLERHGGHAAAAGFTIKNENLPEFKQRMYDIAFRELGGKDLTPQLHADVEVALSNLNTDIMQFLDLMQPTGYGNPEPVFVCRNLRVVAKRQIGADKRHLKLTLSDGWASMDAICFRFGYLYEVLPTEIDVLCTFEINEFNGVRNFQLNVKDIHASA